MSQLSYKDIDTIATKITNKYNIPYENVFHFIQQTVTKSINKSPQSGPFDPKICWAPRKKRYNFTFDENIVIPPSPFVQRTTESEKTETDE